jgi:exonuclease SbcC
MKILKVKFENINSFRGKHEVDFNTPEIKQQGIFTITGPTGAGKTTILDAITVALYNRVSRHDKDTEHIMSRHTKECKSEVDFEVNGEQYRSVWSCYMTNPRKEDKQPEAKCDMDLYHLSGNDEKRAIATKHTGVPTKIEELIKLSYDQFTRSVLLAQGQFDAFLHADTKVKSGLLEQITGIDIYTKIGKFTHQKYTEQKAILEGLEREKSYLNLLSDEQLTQLLANIDEIQQQKKQLEANINLQSEQLELLRKIAQEQEAYTEHQTNYHNAQAHLAQLQPQIQRLEKHKNALPLQKNLDEWKHIVGDIDDLNKKVKTAETQHIALNSSKKELHTQLTSLQQKLATCQTEQQTKEPIIAQILRYETQLADKQLALQPLQITQKSLSAQINTLKTQIEEQKKRFEQTQTQKQTLANWLQQHDADRDINVQLIANQLTALNETRQKYTEQTEIHKQQTEQAENFAQKQAQNHAIEQQINEDIAAIQKQTNAQREQINALPTPDLLNQIVAQLQDTIPLLKSQISFSKDFADKNELRQQLLNDLVAQKEALKNEEKDKTDQELALSAANTLLETTEKLYEAEKTIANFDQHRQKLQPNQPCPLCGSTHHPLANDYVPQLSKTEQQRNQQRNEVDNLNKKLIATGKNIVAISTKIDHIVTKGKEIKADLDKLKSNFEQQNTRLGLLISIDNEQKLNLLLTEKQQELDEAKTKQTNYQALNKALEQLKTNQNDLQNQQLKCKNQQAILVEQQKSATENAKKAHNEAQKLKLEGEQKANQLNQMLQPYQLRIPNKNETPKFVSDLQERHTNWQNKQQELQNTEKAALELQTNTEKISLSLGNEQKNCTKITTDLQQLQTEIADLQQNIALNMASFELKNATQERLRIAKLITEYEQTKQDINALLVEIKTKIKNQEQFIIDTKAQRETMFGLAQFEEQNLQKKIPLAGFSTIKELDDAFLDHQIAQKIETEVAQKRETLAQTQSLLANSQQNLANLQQQNTTNYSIEGLSQMFAEQKKQLQEHSEQIGKLMQQKSNHEAQLEKATALNQKINAQRLIYARWDTIKKVVGAADGKDFRATAQAITLDHLVLLANRHIKQLSDRYIIQKNNSGLKDKELELEIIDLHQADITRPMKSLSGGESFLISLALALGLSDLASKNRPINTLFIDEGFGSLSPDALEMAINTFENLQEQGKIIGIISHVDALKERIPVQIQVSKKGNSGTSEINIVFK